MKGRSGGTAWQMEGPPDAPVIVLIHGLGLSAASTWDEIAPHLAQDWRVLRYDLPGHGTSEPLASPPDLSALARQLVALLDDLGIEQAVLAGFSLGGMINRRFAMDYPERVRGLVILNSPHKRASELQQRVEQQARDAMNDGPESVVDAALARWFTEAYQDEQAAHVAEIRSVVIANDPQSYGAHRWVLANGVRELTEPEHPISCLVTVVTCENDIGSTPDMARAIAEEIPGATLEIIPGLRHLGLLESPAQFVHIIKEFMQKL